MFRANIYSIEPLSPLARDAVHEGIQMVAAYMGQTATTSELLVRLPLNTDGRVNPRRVGFKNLDKMVDLHLMAVPVDRGESEKLGQAGVGLGWAFSDVTEDNSQIIRTTTAHEVAHAFGHVNPESEQSDPNSRGHCVCQDCVMHRVALYRTVQMELPRPEPEKLKGLKAIFKRKQPVIEPPETVRVKQYHQYDFCASCKLDLYHDSDRNLANMRYRRLLDRNGV